jgi:hypothetical protein
LNHKAGTEGQGVTDSFVFGRGWNVENGFLRAFAHGLNEGECIGILLKENRQERLEEQLFGFFAIGLLNVGKVLLNLGGVWVHLITVSFRAERYNRILNFLVDFIC